MLESDSYHHTFHQPTQCNMAVRSQASWTVTGRKGLNLSMEPSVRYGKHYLLNSVHAFIFLFAESVITCIFIHPLLHYHHSIKTLFPPTA